MDVSVVVVNWNGVHHLADCLACLRAQSHPGFETIVVDNGSSDGSVEMVRSRHPEVQLVVLPENVGFSAGNNHGFHRASGRYIALLNNDAFPQPDWLEHLCQALEDHPEVGFCASKILQYPRVDLIDTVGDGFSIFGKGLKTGWNERDEGQYDEPCLVFGACAAAAIYRRTMLEDIGFFDEDFSPANLEDTDLSFRAQLAGYRCLYVPQAVVHHRVSATLRLHGETMFYLSNRNIEYVLWKNMPWPLLLVCMPLHLLHIAGALAYHGTCGRAGILLRAKMDAYRGLSAALRARRDIQNRRRVGIRYIASLLDRNPLSARPLLRSFQVKSEV